MMYSGSMYLVVKTKGYQGLTGRLCAKKPSVKPGEVPIKLDVKIPEALFKKPQITALVTIPENVAPNHIEADVLDNVKKAFEKETGLQIGVVIVNDAETL